jgi:hypothetical protein
MVKSKSDFLAKEDVGEDGRNLTIAGFDKRMVGREADAEEKFVILWEEDMKPLTLNKTNKNKLKALFGDVDSKELRGKVINVYNNPDIEFGGEIVGGVRIRKATEQSEEASEDPNDDIPW